MTRCRGKKLHGSAKCTPERWPAGLATSGPTAPVQARSASVSAEVKDWQTRGARQRPRWPRSAAASRREIPFPRHHHRRRLAPSTRNFSVADRYISERIRFDPERNGKQGARHGLRIRYVDHFSAHQTVSISKPNQRRARTARRRKRPFCTLFNRRVAVRLVGVVCNNLATDKTQARISLTPMPTAVVLEPRPRVRPRPPATAGTPFFYGKGASARANITPQAQRPASSSTPCCSGSLVC